MKSTRHLRLLTGAVLPVSLLIAACGAGDDTPSGDGDTNNTMGAGATTGAGATSGAGADTGSGGLNDSGGTEGAGATPGDGGGDGTGGDGGASTGRVPGTEDYNCDPAVGTVGTLGLTQVGSGFTRPILVTHAPNDARLFVVEQEGVIKINGGGTFLDITSKAVGPIETDQSWDERGLLGLAFHPDYATNGLFYVFYSTYSASVIAEYKVSADPNVADASSERVLLTIPQTHENHKGGTLAFGADGYLYASVGDGGSTPTTDGGDPESNGQNPSTLKGTILRLDATGTPTAMGNYPGGAPEVSDIGLRNPFRMNFDACNGDLYIGDVGQEVVEEINVKKAGAEHLNFGWKTMEGTTCFNPANKTSPLATCDQTGLTLPIVEYSRGAGAAIIGGAVYRGTEIPGLRGTYFYADNIQGSVYSLVYNRDTGTASAPTTHTSTIQLTNPVAIQNGPGGEIYFLSLTGTLYKLVAL